MNVDDEITKGGKKIEPETCPRDCGHQVDRHDELANGSIGQCWDCEECHGDKGEPILKDTIFDNSDIKTPT